MKRVINCNSDEDKYVKYKFSTVYPTKNFDGYKEVGMHCGTLTQALSFGENRKGELYKIILNHNIHIAYIPEDCEDWSSLNFVYRLYRNGILSDKDVHELEYKLRTKNYTEQQQSSIIRNILVQQKHLDCIAYQNDSEGYGISYIILNPNAIDAIESI